MFLDAIVRLYEYQREVNNHLLHVAESVSNDEFIALIIEGQPSIGDTLVHMIDVIDIHFAWWNYSLGNQIPNVPKRVTEEIIDLNSVRKFWELVDDSVAKCVDSLDSDEQLDRPYIRAFPDGSRNTRKLWEMMLHVINHGTQHRSEVAMMLTKLGHSPGNMEIL
jgi:uncharacterized damage-inducible protein DinB